MYDTNNQCVTCGAHIADPHDPTCHDGNAENVLHVYGDSLADQTPDEARDALDEHRYALVEQSVYSGGGHYITGHASPEEAATYQTGQECANDWTAVKLVDLDTGDEFTPEYRIVWTRAS